MASQSPQFTFRVCGSFSGFGNTQWEKKARQYLFCPWHLSFIHLHSSCLASCPKCCSIYRHWHVCAKLQPVATTNTSAVIFVSFEKLTVFVLKSFFKFLKHFCVCGCAVCISLHFHMLRTYRHGPKVWPGMWFWSQKTKRKLKLDAIKIASHSILIARPAPAAAISKI